MVLILRKAMMVGMGGQPENEQVFFKVF